MKIMVTGGAGFIGATLVKYLVLEKGYEVLNVDKLTYAGNLSSICSVADSDKYHFLQADICDASAMEKAIFEFQPNAIMHLAAESHVDRSIDAPAEFLKTNIMGTYCLLEIARRFHASLNNERKFRFHHISTDEVYGDLDETSLPFSETNPYAPSSPYSASKASADHLVRAWHKTYGLPVVLSNCSNNYGPFHFPEKLIPLTIINAMSHKPISLYGDGSQVRDWLYVEDHVRALVLIMENGEIGETYNVGGSNEVSNLEVVYMVCDELLRIQAANAPIDGYRRLIQFVEDRPGHDKRYAINASKINNELNWHPQETFESGLRKTVQWYVDNKTWWQDIRDQKYQGERLGAISRVLK